MQSTAQLSDLENTFTLKGCPSSQYSSGAIGIECRVIPETLSTGLIAFKTSGKPGQTENDWIALHNDGAVIYNKEYLGSQYNSWVSGKTNQK